MGRTSGRPNLGRLAEGELAAFSKHSFVVATLLLYNNKDIILFLEIEKKCVFEKRREKYTILTTQNRVHTIQNSIPLKKVKREDLSDTGYGVDQNLVPFAHVPTVDVIVRALRDGQHVVLIHLFG